MSCPSGQSSGVCLGLNLPISRNGIADIGHRISHVQQQGRDAAWDGLKSNLLPNLIGLFSYSYEDLSNLYSWRYGALSGRQIAFKSVLLMVLLGEKWR